MPAGATMLYHEVTSKPGNPDSSSVGSAGADARRFGLATPSARSLPDATWGIADDVPANMTWTSPATTAVTAGAMP